MAIITKEIQEIKRILSLNESNEQKIWLLERVTLSTTSKCLSCQGRRNRTQVILDKMIRFEIAKLKAEEKES